MTPRKKHQPRTFWGDFREFFVRGLVILLPSVLTLWILVASFSFVQANVAEPINSGLRQGVMWIVPQVYSEETMPSWFRVSDDVLESAKALRLQQGQSALSDSTVITQIRSASLKEWWDGHWYVRLIGLAVAIVLIYLAGVLLGGFIGRRVYSRIEHGFKRVPVFKSVYPHVKQVVDFLLGGSGGPDTSGFERVVLVEYPSKGIWTVGLQTGPSMRSIEAHTKASTVTIFIPSSPAPFTGYTINVPEKNAIPLPISIDEAVRFVVTGGVVIPDHELVTHPRQSTPVPDRGLASGPTAGMMKSAD